MKTARGVVALTGLAFGTAVAEPLSFSDWAVDVDGDQTSVYAATINDSGSIFGEFCSLSSDSCSWRLGLEVSCERDSTYPVLANTDAGAAHLTVQCDGKIEGNGKYHRYIFTDWSALETLLKQSKRVGFAFPLQSDQFTVIRFSLNGMKQAAENAEYLAQSLKAQRNSGSPGTANQIL